MYKEQSRAREVEPSVNRGKDRSMSRNLLYSHWLELTLSV